MLLDYVLYILKLNEIPDLYKILNNIRKKCLDIILKNKLHKWHLLAKQKKLDDLKAETFIQIVFLSITLNNILSHK